jgi:flagellar basal-body rod modification protein FlgD
MRSYEDYKNQTRTINNNLGKNDFLKLLAAQLQYQDPMEPTKDTDFIAQLAQFSSLQQMESLNKIMTTFQYYGLAGKFISGEIELEDGTAAVVYGMVDRVVSKNGETYLQVGDKMIEASKVTEVYDKDLFVGDGTLLEAAHIIGCTVRARIADPETGETTEVSGVVSRVSLEENRLYAYLDNGDVKVPVSNIVDIQK